MELHPGGDASRWNLRQIVEHLMLTYERSGAIARERLDKDRPTQARATASQRWVQFGILGLGYFPHGHPAPLIVTPVAVPDRAMDGATLAGRFQASLESIDEILKSCGGSFGQQKFASHQILGPLSADQWRRFHVVHARHHLKQIRRLRVET